MAHSELERYSRQMLLPEIGREGQERLLRSRVVIVGLGALGGVIASTLVRAGVGYLRLIDRDFIEENNLQRQILFDEEDIAANLPKATAAEQKLRRVNHQVTVAGVVADLNPDNVESLIADCDLVLDGTDNLETRLLLNDACVKQGRPWIYGAAIATYGVVMPILPGEGPCFRCFLPELPPPGSVATCDTAGILGTTPLVVASLEVTEAIKLLSGNRQALLRGAVYVDLWEGTLERMEVRKGETPCPACDEGCFEFLQGRRGTVVTSLCGRTAVQIRLRGAAAPDFTRLAERLAPLGQVTHNPYMLRFRSEPYEIVLFPDGRAIIGGTTDEGIARSLYARYIGL